MRVLVVSEGRHELGVGPASSPIVTLTGRILPGNCNFTTEKVSSDKVRLHLPRGKAEAYERRALGWIKYAEQQRFDALVLVIDQDGQKEREQGIANAQASARFALRRALGVAIVAFDAWMLADEKALSRAMGTVVARQKSPEDMKAPKDQCTRLCQECGHESGLAELYQGIAQCIDLDVLAERCPRGFAPFRERLLSVASS